MGPWVKTLHIQHHVSVTHLAWLVNLKTFTLSYQRYNNWLTAIAENKHRLHFPVKVMIIFPMTLSTTLRLNSTKRSNNRGNFRSRNEKTFLRMNFLIEAESRKSQTSVVILQKNVGTVSIAESSKALLEKGKVLGSHPSPGRLKKSIFRRK